MSNRGAIDFLREYRSEFPVQIPAAGLSYDWDLERANALKQLISIIGRERAEAGIATCTAQLRELLIEVPAPERHAPFYWLLARNAILAMTALQDMGERIDAFPIVDSFPTVTINAVTIKPPRVDQFLVLFPYGIKLFTSLIMDVVLAGADLLPRRVTEFAGVPDYHLIHQTLSSETDLIGRFQQIIVVYLRDASPYALDPFGPTPRDQFHAGRLKAGADLFLLAHEFAHIARNHFVPHEPPQSGVVIVTRDGKIEVPSHVRLKWDDEFEADERALAAIAHLSKRVDANEADFFCGAYLLLACLQLLQRGICMLARGNAQQAASASHPPIDTRLERLRMLAENRISAAAVRQAHVLEYVAKFLFDQLSRKLVIAHVQGLRPAKQWAIEAICQ